MLCLFQPNLQGILTDLSFKYVVFVKIALDFVVKDLTYPEVSYYNFTLYNLKKLHIIIGFASKNCKTNVQIDTTLPFSNNNSLLN